ncbi:MAG: peptidoglycan DD-metalloendopeptidase family protein [Acidobacteria bacterium]|nr:peptidoglycan DD-metalloendopeptidase family protein [Acidobacteriota bacterium]
MEPISQLVMLCLGGMAAWLTLAVRERRTTTGECYATVAASRLRPRHRSGSRYGVTLTSAIVLGAFGLLAPHLAAAEETAASDEAVAAPQGSVVRWSGEAESCGMGGKTWKANEGVCYFPIDFEHPAGRIEIARWPKAGERETRWLDIEDKDFGEENVEYPDDSLIHLSEEDLARHSREQAEIEPVFKTDTEPVYSLPLAPPAKPLPEGKEFGVERSFNDVPKSAHTGADYPIGLDNPVHAVAAGKVVLTGEHLFAGNSVYVDHGDGLVSMYFHLNSIEVEEGQTVAAGDELGKVGETGRATGPHLHLGLRWRDARIDPTLLIGKLQVVDVP